LLQLAWTLFGFDALTKQKCVGSATTSRSPVLHRAPEQRFREGRFIGVSSDSGAAAAASMAAESLLSPAIQDSYYPINLYARFLPNI